jgi:hypothetical protein
MKRLCGAILLALISGTAAADWVQWAADPKTKITYYYDPASVKKTGNLARMSILFDFPKPVEERGKLYSSLVEQGEYDCKATRLRVIQSTWHTGRMGRGKGLASLKKPEPWVEKTEQLEERAWKIACGK